MKIEKVNICIKIIFSVLILIYFGTKDTYGQPINAIIGDESYVSKFGVLPVATNNEDLRIKTHLEYVENLLRKKDVTGLDEAQNERRELLLDLLHDYWTAGIFPRNYDYQNQRMSCFIDKDGRICAVGYLIEPNYRTGGC